MKYKKEEIIKGNIYFDLDGFIDIHGGKLYALIFNFFNNYNKLIHNVKILIGVFAS